MSAYSSSRRLFGDQATQKHVKKENEERYHILALRQTHFRISGRGQYSFPMSLLSSSSSHLDGIGWKCLQGGALQSLSNSEQKNREKCNFEDPTCKIYAHHASTNDRLLCVNDVKCMHLFFSRFLFFCSPPASPTLPSPVNVCQDRYPIASENPPANHSKATRQMRTTYG